MANTYFACKQFTIQQANNAMKVTTDGCLFGAWVAHKIKGFKGTVLDVGAGTGLLSLQIAQQTNATIAAVEIQPAAAAECAENFRNSVFSNQCVVVETSFQRFAENTPTCFDVIVSNPPFYEHSLASASTAKNAAHHSTELSLAELFSCSKKLLQQPYGQLFLLLPFYRLQETIALAHSYKWYAQETVVVYPNTTKPAFRVMLCLTAEAEPNLRQQYLYIRNATNGYSHEFIKLLQPYYLFL